MNLRSISLIFCVLYILVLENCETTFVTLGEYPNHQKYQINDPECGLLYAPKAFDISFKSNCFTKNIPNITYYIHYFTKQEKEMNSIKNRVFRGEESYEGESPFTVRIRYTTSLDKLIHLCTGVLITFQWVLTAAHCDKKGNNQFFEKLVIYAGSNRIGGGWKIESEQVYKHKGFTEDFDASLRGEALYKQYDNDIALIKLKGKFVKRMNGNKYVINTVCLPTVSTTMNDKPGERATFFGWGLLESDKRTEKLMKGVFELEAFEKCYNLLLCSLFNDSYTGPRTCVEDSGGPLVQYDNAYNITKRAILVGTLIGGSPTGAGKYERKCKIKSLVDSLWAAVPKYIDWILKTISEN